jgi:hypothetical protein
MLASSRAGPLDDYLRILDFEPIFRSFPCVHVIAVDRWHVRRPHFQSFSQAPPPQFPSTTRYIGPNFEAGTKSPPLEDLSFSHFNDFRPQINEDISQYHIFAGFKEMQHSRSEYIKGLKGLKHFASASKVLPISLIVPPAFRGKLQGQPVSWRWPGQFTSSLR